MTDHFVPAPPCVDLDDNLEMSFELTFVDYPHPAPAPLELDYAEEWWERES